MFKEAVHDNIKKTLSRDLMYSPPTFHRSSVMVPVGVIFSPVYFSLLQVVTSFSFP